MIVTLSVVWVAYRTIEQAQASSQSVVQTQEVLTTLETVLGTLIDADNAVRSGASPADAERSNPSIGQNAPPAGISIGWPR